MATASRSQSPRQKRAVLSGPGLSRFGRAIMLCVGLHSYGFGKGAVASRVYLIGGIDLVVVLACFLVYLARQRPGVLVPAGGPAAS